MPTTSEKTDGAKRPIGRPTRYRREFCEQVEQAMGEGYSLSGFAGQIGVTRSSLNVWMAAHAEFLEAVNRAKAARAYFWETKARRVAEVGGGPGTAAVLTLMLRNAAPAEYGADRRANVTLPNVDSAPAAKAAMTEIIGLFARGEIDESHARAIVAMCGQFLDVAELERLRAQIDEIERRQ